MLPSLEISGIWAWSTITGKLLLIMIVCVVVSMYDDHEAPDDNHEVLRHMGRIYRIAGSCVLPEMVMVMVMSV